MKKLSILAFAMGLIAFTACSEKKAPAPAPTQAEQTVVTDSALPAKPEGKAAVIILSRKGLDADVQEQATLDTEEGSIIIKNETFRKK